MERKELELDASSEVRILAWMFDSLPKNYEAFPKNMQMDEQPGDVADMVDLEAAIRLLRKEIIS